MMIHGNIVLNVTTSITNQNTPRPRAHARAHEENTMTIIPATPGWIIEWKNGYGPPADRIIAWEITDEDPIPITTGGREHIGKTARIRHLHDDAPIDASYW